MLLLFLFTIKGKLQISLRTRDFFHNSHGSDPDPYLRNGWIRTHIQTLLSTLTFFLNLLLTLLADVGGYFRLNVAFALRLHIHIVSTFSPVRKYTLFGFLMNPTGFISNHAVFPGCASVHQAEELEQDRTDPAPHLLIQNPAPVR